MSMTSSAVGELIFDDGTRRRKETKTRTYRHDAVHRLLLSSSSRHRHSPICDDLLQIGGQYSWVLARRTTVSDSIRINSRSARSTKWLPMSLERLLSLAKTELIISTTGASVAPEEPSKCTAEQNF